MTTYKGVLHFHSETGTEGGYWAFQDEKFMHGEVEHCPWGEEGRWADDGPPSCPGMRSNYTPARWKGEPPEKIGHWSYEGLHVLDDGDKVTVYSPEDYAVVWDGVINLEQHSLFTEDAFGMWIHADQFGEDRETWARMFLEEWPAELTTP